MKQGETEHNYKIKSSCFYTKRCFVSLTMVLSRDNIKKVLHECTAFIILIQFGETALHVAAKNLSIAIALELLDDMRSQMSQSDFVKAVNQRNSVSIELSNKFPLLYYWYRSFIMLMIRTHGVGNFDDRQFL